MANAAQGRDAELSAPCRCVYPEKCACKPEQKSAVSCQEEPMSDLPECWINGARFAGDFVREHMTGAQIRALPVPSIKDDQDLFVEQPGNEDLFVQHDEVVPVVGRRFFSVPRFINAG